jgi:hypothetical protein
VIDDTNALRARLLQWAEIESLKRILVAHGLSIEDNPGRCCASLPARWLEGKPSTALPRRNRHMAITGSCHCGKTAVRIDGEVPEQITRCTCSFCAKRGVLLAYFEPQQFHPTVLSANDAVYRWQTKQVARLAS